MRVLEQLEPQGVFRFFEELCAIPHGSRNCQAVSDWCVAFARERGLECHQDQAGNVIIIQEATPGYEAAAPVILQGHLDMVCEKEPGCTKDMAGEGLDLLVEDGCVRAKGTTLGGDDGIAVAMALAILDDQAIPHPRLEVVLTTDEEIGMLGAEALDAAPLRGRKLINVDSEELRRRKHGPVHSARDPGALWRRGAGGDGPGACRGALRHRDPQGPGQCLCAAGPIAPGHGGTDGAAPGDGGGRRKGQRHRRGGVRPGGGI